MPNNILGFCCIGVNMDEVLAYADAPYADGQRRTDNLRAGVVGIANDVCRLALAMGAIPRPPLGFIPGDGTICTGELQGNPCLCAESVQGVHKSLIHLLQGAGRRAFLELGLFEILGGNHISFSLLPPGPPAHTNNARSAS